MAARRAPRLAFVLAASALLAAPAASGAIVPQQGIAGVRLGMTQARVRTVLGPPSSVKRATNDFGRFTELRYPGLRVTFQGGNSVTNVSTTRTSEKTAGGAGVGSTESQLRAHVRGLRCATESGFRHCSLGRFLPGHRVTDFAIRHGRVVRADVGFVVD